MSKTEIIKGSDTSLQELLGGEYYTELQLKSVVERAAKGDFMPSLQSWLKQTRPDYNWSWQYMKYLIDNLQKLSDGKIRKLMISLPPRSGKSTLCSIHFPVYFLEKNPENRVIIGTYNQTLANKMSRGVRTIAKTKIPLNPDRKAMEEWETLAGGGVRAVGVGAGIAGIGANLIILDDVVRSRKDASSITVRNSTYAWYTDDIFTRMEPDSRILIIMCLRGSSNVLMSDGTWKQIKDIIPGEYVVSYNIDKKIFENKKVLNQAQTGHDNTYTVKTSSETLTANAKHPFLTTEGYKNTSDLRVGDRLITTNYIETVEDLPKLYDNKEMTDEFSWFLGFMFGDGWVTSWNRNNYDKIRDRYYNSKSWAVCFSAGIREELNNKVLYLFEKYFNRSPVYKTKERYYRIDANSVGRYLESVGLSSEYTAKTKRVPEWVFNAPVEMRREFIRGFMAADGYRNKNTKKERYSSVLCNKDLLNDIRMLGLTCGVRPTQIHSREYVAQPPNSPEQILCENFTASFNFVDIDNTEQYRTSVIKSIEYNSEKEPVYDLEVEDNHNFVAEGIVVSNTRWHEDDLIGRIERLEDDWTVINLPAIAEDNDPLGRKPGEALNPERYPIEKLYEIRRVLGRSFNALYQGRPTEQEGEIFKASWFRDHMIKTLPQDGKRRYEFVRYWDKAASEKRGDYTVGVLMARDRSTKTYYILNVVRGQWESVERDRIMLETAAKDQAEYRLLGSVRICHEQEPGSAGKDAKNYTNKLLAGFPVKAVKVTGNKKLRAEPYASQCEAGNVYIMQGSWNEDFIDEHAVFDNGAHDDMVDAASGAFNQLSKGSGFISLGKGLLAE